MAAIVLGVGTAHSPMCSEPPEFWAQHGAEDQKDPRRLEELRKHFNTPPVPEERLALEEFTALYERTQAAIAELAKVIAAADLDVLVVVGDDQDDLFEHKVFMPSIAIFGGDHIVNPPHEPTQYPEWRRATLWGHYPELVAESYKCEPLLAAHLTSTLTAAGIDVAYVAGEFGDRHIGHAFTFLNRRLISDSLAIVPVMLNTYFPPNQPTSARCYDVGQAIARGIESWPSDTRVGIAASGGLTHPVLDEGLDRMVLDALARNDREALVSIPEEQMLLGTTEIKNWVTVAGALAHSGLEFQLIDYIPAYRSALSTGCGLAFSTWS